MQPTDRRSSVAIGAFAFSVRDCLTNTPAAGLLMDAPRTSAIVRSVENLPMPATLSTVRRVHSIGLRYTSSTAACACGGG